MFQWDKEPATVVLKFQNGKRNSPNKVVSLTMGKVAVIAHAYQGRMPQPSSFWVCRIVKETGSGTTNGCFIIEPVFEIPLAKVMKLVPGMYDTEIRGNTVLCKPKVHDIFWIIPFSLKKYFLKEGKAEIQYQSVIVPLKISETQHAT